MVFTYDLGTDIGRVRLNIGDTTSTNAKLSDAEIQVALDDEVDVLQASKRCVELIIAQLASQPDRSVVGINSTNPIDHYKQLLEALSNRSSVSLAVTGYAGSISKDRINDAKADSDFIKPAFEVGRDDNKSTQDPAIEAVDP